LYGANILVNFDPHNLNPKVNMYIDPKISACLEKAFKYQFKHIYNLILSLDYIL